MMANTTNLTMTKDATNHDYGDDDEDNDDENEGDDDDEREKENGDTWYICPSTRADRQQS